VENILKKMKPSSCALDPCPSSLIKSNRAAISPLITQIINKSLKSGHVPLPLKTAIIKPLLKKSTLDQDILSNYRPISHLPFLSKVLEKAVATQLQLHLEQNSLYEKFQSGFRSAHSTETALLRVTNDIYMAADAGSTSLLVLLDLTAAFDTVDHNILLHRLHAEVGLCDTVLDWFKSFLSNRLECVSLGKAKSQAVSVSCGVPQGSVLGPLLFSLYMLPLGQIINRYNISFHCYADDIQLYIRTGASSPSSLNAFTTCLEEIRKWMTQNFLQLNCSKTEAMLIGTPHQVQSSTMTTVFFSGQDIPLSTIVTNLGVRMDSQLTFENHIKHLFKICFLHLRNISKIRPFLSFSDAETLVHAFVSSRLDYCNSLFVGIHKKHLQKLQYIQNSAARILLRARKSAHITPILHDLHWLPITCRIQYKIALITHQCLNGSSPDYLKDLLTPHSSTRSLRSQDCNFLHLPRSRLRSMGDRAFAVAAPRLWNSLPDHLRAPQPLTDFKRGLKTFLFKQAYSAST